MELDHPFTQPKCQYLSDLGWLHECWPCTMLRQARSRILKIVRSLAVDWTVVIVRTLAVGCIVVIACSLAMNG